MNRASGRVTEGGEARGRGGGALLEFLRVQRVVASVSVVRGSLKSTPHIVTVAGEPKPVSEGRWNGRKFEAAVTSSGMAKV